MDVAPILGLAVWIAGSILGALTLSFLDGRNGTDGEWLIPVAFWPMFLLAGVIITAIWAPFGLAHWLGEQCRMIQSSSEPTDAEGHIRNSTGGTPNAKP